MIFETFVAGPIETNTYLIGCEKTKKGAVIDVPIESASKLLELIEKHGLKIEKILLTHSHWDHIGDLAFLKEKTGAKVFVHEADAANVRHPGSDKLPSFFAMDATDIDGFLQDGEEISVGTLEIEVIHTPGHSPGGVCLYFPDEKILFSGDTLFAGSIGILNTPTGEPEKMWSSLKRLAKLPKETKVYPGHRGPTTIGREEWLDKAQVIFG